VTRCAAIALLITGLSLISATARATDPTDSILTYGCDPPLPRSAANCAIWHTSPVNLRWTLVDPNFTPVPGSHCETTFINYDTAGTDVTCAVQDAALSQVQKTVRLRVDQTAPSVTGATPARAADHAGWWNHAVAWTFTGSDATSGLAGCDTVTYSGPDSGTGDVKGDCRDVAGNARTGHAAIKYDAAPPTITSVTPSRPADHDGWWNHPVSIVFAGTDGTSGLDSCDTIVYSGGPAPSANVTGHCRDFAGNVATGSMVVNYDDQPPTLTALPAEVGSNDAVLHWAASPDTVLTEVTRSPGIGDAAASTVYSGTGETLSDPGVKNDVTYTYSIRAWDAAANLASATVAVTPRAAPTPQPDAAPTLTSAPAPVVLPTRSAGTRKPLLPPRLQWRRVKGADYYNVQLYRGGRKILSLWPNSTHLQLALRWRFRGHLMRLTTGRYDWYVWPGFGTRARRDYGRLLLHRRFTFGPTGTTTG
jgi:hypothetical protein